MSAERYGLEDAAKTLVKFIRQALPDLSAADQQELDDVIEFCQETEETLIDAAVMADAIRDIAKSLERK